MSRKPKNTAAISAGDGPAVNCAFDELVETGRVQPNQDNPNKHPAEQLALYAKILLHQGWRKPIVVSKQSGRIVTGHGAWETAKAEGWPKVPVDYQEFKTPADECAHMLADNRLPQLAELDEAEFAAILAREVEGKLDIDLAGVLEEEPAKTELRPVEVKAPPKMAWVLIGIPLVEFSKVNAAIEQIAAVAGVVMESTVNDQTAQL